MKFKKFQNTLIIFLIAVGFFYGGYYFGKRGFVFEVRKNPPEIKITNKLPPKGELDFSLFWEVWDTLNTTYLERPIDQKAMMYGAISGMVGSLGDPYTTFLPPEINKSFMDSMGGKYEGIGAELSLKDGSLVIVAPLDGSPAKRAGLKAGDRILQIDDRSTAGMDVSEAVSLIRGSSGTQVKLVIQTGTSDPRDITLTRGVITVSSVTWEDKGDGTAYIRISRFGTETNREWDKVASEINVKMNELDAVIIDVRGNPGGYLDSAVHISEDFFRGKPVLVEELSTGEKIPFKTSKVGIFKDIPGVFVLIDQGSASASEILAAALRDNIGAKIIGMKSFGKGTIQDAKDFKDGSGLHVTIAKWLTPKEDWVHKNGLEPDVTVEVTEEDLDNNIDAQLNKALEMAKEI
jgi:carboxyl-terminal processing protease